jgi:hypothetical protein
VTRARFELRARGSAPRRRPTPRSTARHARGSAVASAVALEGVSSAVKPRTRSACGSIRGRRIFLNSSPAAAGGDQELGPTLRSGCLRGAKAKARGVSSGAAIMGYSSDRRFLAAARRCLSRPVPGSPSTCHTLVKCARSQQGTTLYRPSPTRRAEALVPACLGAFARVTSLGDTERRDPRVGGSALAFPGFSGRNHPPCNRRRCQRVSRWEGGLDREADRSEGQDPRPTRFR